MIVGVFADINNLYFHVGKKFNRKLDYQKLLTRLVGQNTLHRAMAYGTQTDAKRFIAYLRHINFEPKFEDCDPYIDIILDIVRQIDKLDVVYICSNNTALLPLLSFIRDKGVKVIIVCANVNYPLRNAADNWIEIDDSLLEAPCSTT